MLKTIAIVEKRIQNKIPIINLKKKKNRIPNKKEFLPKEFLDEKLVTVFESLKATLRKLIKIREKEKGKKNREKV